MTLKTQFKKIYSEHLEEYGFKYAKDFKCFVKYDEKAGLIFYIDYNERVTLSEKNGFSINVGVVSIYCDSKIVTDYKLCDVREDMYEFVDGKERDCRFELTTFVYRKDDDVEMNNALQKSIMMVKKYVLPKWKKLIDLNSYINYENARENGRKTFYQCDVFRKDSLALIVADNHYNYQEMYDEIVKKVKKLWNDRIDLTETYRKIHMEEHIERIHEDFFDFLINPRDQVFNDSKLLKEALAEAARRKEQNEALLKANKIF